MYTIKNFAKLIGLEPHQIRKLEEVLKIDLGVRDENGYRNYDIASAFAINSLLALNSMGFTRKEALEIMNGEMNREEIALNVEKNTKEMMQQKLLLERKIFNNNLYLQVSKDFEKYKRNIEEISSKAICFVAATKKNESLEPAENLDEESIKELVRNIPLTIIGAKVSSDDYELGYFIFEDDLQHYQISKETFKKYEGSGCLRFFCRLDEAKINQDDYEYLKEYAAKHHYELLDVMFIDCMNGRNLEYNDYFLTYIPYK